MTFDPFHPSLDNAPLAGVPAERWTAEEMMIGKAPGHGPRLQKTETGEAGHFEGRMEGIERHKCLIPG
jgi:hypothetical protein